MTSFKEVLAHTGPSLGLWQALANPYTAEICAQVGFDWLLLDGEHSPNTLQTMLAQAQAVAPYSPVPVARVPWRDPVTIKLYLDIGLHALLVPMIETPEDAGEMVTACRYAPQGTRGVSSATARAAGFGADANYLREANERVTLIVQIESRKGVENAGAIAAVSGVDAVFVGPADLAASMGHIGEPLHPEVQQAIATVKEAVEQAGKPIGIFAVSPEDARRRVEQGYKFISIGTDIGILREGALALLESVRSR